MKFCSGQRVRYIGPPSGLHLGVDINELGTVLYEYKVDDYVSVRWDMYGKKRHTCNGLCEPGHGWNVGVQHITAYVDDLGDFTPNLAPVSIMELLGG